MKDYPLKGRLVPRIADSSILFVKPLIRDQKKISLKGRVHALPKTTFWHRLGSWLFVEEEKSAG